jgi:hypothetical protein
MECIARLRGATVARLTPDQKAACSNHVGVNHVLANFDKIKYTRAEENNVCPALGAPIINPVSLV